MKKLLSLMLAAALTLSLACPAFAAGSGSVRVEDIDAKPGSEIKVPVYLAENPGVAYLKLKISYDKGLTCTNIESTVTINAAIINGNAMITISHNAFRTIIRAVLTVNS